MKTFTRIATIAFFTLIAFDITRAETALLGSGAEHPADAPVAVSVGYLEESSTDIGLTEDFISSKVKGRLRKNGIEPEAPNVFESDLLISVTLWTTEEGAFRFDVSCNRQVTYEVNGKKFRIGADTFRKSGFGYYGSKPKSQRRDLILQYLLHGIDELSAEILQSAL